MSETAKAIPHGRQIVRFNASSIQICSIFGIPYISYQHAPTARLTNGSSQKSQNSERDKPIRSGHIIVKFLSCAYWHADTWVAQDAERVRIASRAKIGNVRWCLKSKDAIFFSVSLHPSSATRCHLTQVWKCKKCDK